MNPKKTYAKFYEPLSEHIPIGRKFDGCDCIVFAKNSEEITVELCDYHIKSVKEGNVKYLHPIQTPAYPKTVEVESSS